MADIGVELTDISVFRASHQILTGLNLSIGTGECRAIVGRSGAGKTTLGLAVAGLIPLDSGAVDRSGGGRTAMMLQRSEDCLLASTADQEVALLPRLDGCAPDEVHRRVSWAMSAAGVPEDLGSVDTLHLSGGERRRVALAAALSGAPDLLVLDEPTAGLDHRSRWVVINSIRELCNEGVTVVVITHDMRVVAAAADSVTVLADGTVAGTGPIADMLAPTNADMFDGLGLLAEVAAARAAASIDAQEQLPSTYDADVLIKYTAEAMKSSAGGTP